MTNAKGDEMIAQINKLRAKLSDKSMNARQCQVLEEAIADLRVKLAKTLAGAK